MSNAGFANSSGAIIYLILLLLPTTVCLATPLINKLYSRNYIRQTCNASNTVYKTIYVEKPAKINKTVRLNNEKQLETSAELLTNTRQALVKLGYRVRDAKSVIEKMCKNKCYTDEVSLIRDCVSYTHKNK
jgi:hypothetical protein